MSGESVATTQVETAEFSITVRYWAAARAATGVAQDVFEVEGSLALAEVVRRVHAAHPSTRVADVIGVCSVLVGDEPAGTRDPEMVSVEPGTIIEFLPPFAGG